MTGGNPDLKPDKSRQFNAGMVWAPLREFSLTLDYWKINETNSINVLPEDSLFQYYDRFSSNFVRGPVDPNFLGLPGPIEYIVERNQNVGNLRTSGIDIDVSYRGHITSFGRFGFNLNGTCISEWKEQFDGVNYTSVVGTNINGPVPRWRHYLALNWDSGPWNAALAQTF